MHTTRVNVENRRATVESKVERHPPFVRGVCKGAVDGLTVRDCTIAGSADDRNSSREAFGAGFADPGANVDFAEFVRAGDDPDAVLGVAAVELPLWFGKVC